jgi:hypothetical protein
MGIVVVLWQINEFKFIVIIEDKWRKCMGIEPTRDGFSAPHRI